MKSRLFFAVNLLTVAFLSAQTFKMLPPALAIEADDQGHRALEAADIDNDGDDDILTTGAGERFTRLYRNNGEMQFNEIKGTSLYNVYRGCISFGDVDADGDPDLLLSGEISPSAGAITVLYLNDGIGNFILHDSTTFTRIHNGKMKFVDVDGDQDLDAFIIGSTENFPYRTAEIYFNNGQGAFTKDNTSTIQGASIPAFAFADIDGDMDEDLLIQGPNVATRLYKNDGQGHFIEQINSSIQDLDYGSVCFADLDNDGDKDLIQTGIITNDDEYTQMYINDGLGNFTIVSQHPFINVAYGGTSVFDIDADGDMDLLISGIIDGYNRRTRLYINTGNLNFVEKPNTNFDGFSKTASVYSDFDGDQDLDLLITGSTQNGTSAQLYENDGIGNFNRILNYFFDGIYKGCLAIGKVDGDTAPDIIYSGYDGHFVQHSRYYRNDGEGTGEFTKISDSPFLPLSNGGMLLVDVDNDNDNDLLMNGYSDSNTAITRLYKNDGEGNFSTAPTPFIATKRGKIGAADIDGDNDIDILLAGLNSNDIKITKFYINDGEGNFTQKDFVPFFDISAFAIKFGDFDNDGDKDIFLLGWTNYRIASIFINNGFGEFEELTGTNFELTDEGDADIADVDNDNDLDILITGAIDSWGTRIAKLYLNDGLAHFTENLDVPFTGVDLSSVKFADLNGDGDQDLILAGRTTDGSRIATWYSNDGTGYFIEDTNHNFKEMIEGQIETADVDEDGDLDIFMTGLPYGNVTRAILYINEGGSVFTTEKKEQLSGLLRVYPNPNTSGNFRIEYNSINGAELHVSILDVNGRVFYNNSYAINKGFNNLRIDYISLRSGLYLVKLEEGSKVTYAKLFIIL